MPYSDRLALPHVPGHEICARVIRTDPPVIEPGTVVVVYHLWPCRRCARCRAGVEQLCQNPQGWTGFMTPGGFQQRIAAPIDRLTVVPPEIDPVARGAADLRDRNVVPGGGHPRRVRAGTHGGRDRARRGGDPRAPDRPRRRRARGGHRHLGSGARGRGASSASRRSPPSDAAVEERVTEHLGRRGSRRRHRHRRQPSPRSAHAFRLVQAGRPRRRRRLLGRIEPERRPDGAVRPRGGGAGGLALRSTRRARPGGSPGRRRSRPPGDRPRAAARARRTTPSTALEDGDVVGRVVLDVAGACASRAGLAARAAPRRRPRGSRRSGPARRRPSPEVVDDRERHLGPGLDRRAADVGGEDHVVELEQLRARGRLARSAARSSRRRARRRRSCPREAPRRAPARPLSGRARC